MNNSTALKALKALKSGGSSQKHAFADPAVSFSDSLALKLCYFSHELANDAERSRETIRRFQHLLRQELRELQARNRYKARKRERTHCRRSGHTSDSVSIQDQRGTGLGTGKQTTGKRLLSGNENLDAALLKVRAALAKNRVKAEYGILSYPTHSRIGEAYLGALAGAVRSQHYKTGAAEQVWPGAIQESGTQCLFYDEN